MQRATCNDLLVKSHLVATQMSNMTFEMTEVNKDKKASTELVVSLIKWWLSYCLWWLRKLTMGLPALSVCDWLLFYYYFIIYLICTEKEHSLLSTDNVFP